MMIVELAKPRTADGMLVDVREATDMLHSTRGTVEGLN